MPDLRDVLVEAVQESKTDFLRRLAALAAYDGVPFVSPFDAVAPATFDTEVTNDPSENGSHAPNRRSPELVDYLLGEVVKIVRASPNETRRVTEVHDRLVRSEELVKTAQDREFVRYLLRKASKQGQLRNLGRGSFGLPEPTEGGP